MFYIEKNTFLLVRAYLTYVRPLLKYDSVIWSPRSKCDDDAVVKVQRRYTKRKQKKQKTFDEHVRRVPTDAVTKADYTGQLFTPLITAVLY